MPADYTGTRPPPTAQGNPVLLHKLLGGGPYATAVIAAAVVVFWMNGPGVFESD